MRNPKLTIKPILLASALAAIGCPNVTFAQTTENEQDGSSEISRLHAQIAEMEARDNQRMEQMELLEQRLQVLEERQRLLWDPIDADSAAAMRGAYIPSRSVATPDDASLAFFKHSDIESGPLTGGAAASSTEETEDRKAPAPTEAVEEITRQQQGRFGSSIGFEMGLGYTHFSGSRINLNGFLALDSIFLGTISIDQVNADIFTLDPTVRLGLTDRLFVNASVPYLFRTSNFRSGGAGGSASALVEETVRDSGIGDISIGANYRVIKESSAWPDIVLNAQVKFPTGRDPYGIDLIEIPNTEGNLQVPTHLAMGSGVYGASVGVSALKTLDPMVVFGSLTYFRNFTRHLPDLDENPGDIPGKVSIGNSFQFGAGLAFALNDKSSISMSYTQRIVDRTWLKPDGQDRRPVIGSQANVGLVNLGATFSLSNSVSLLTNVGIGLTEDSPDMSVSIRLPIRF